VPGRRALLQRLVQRAECRAYNAPGATANRPDPIAQARRQEKHRTTLEIGKPFPIEQPAPVEEPEPMPAAAAQSVSGVMVGNLLPPGPSRPVELPQQPGNPVLTNSSSDADAAIVEHQRAQVVWALNSYRVRIAADGVFAWYCRQNAANRRAPLDRLQTFELAQRQPTMHQGIAIAGAVQLLLHNAAAHRSAIEQ
jgi:hypothetical protein